MSQIEVTVDGIKYPSQKDAVRSLGISYDTIRNRMKYYNEDFNTALDSIRNRDNSINYGTECYDHEGRYFCSIKSMCDYHGVKFPTFLRRKHAGYSLKDCLDPVVSYTEKGSHNLVGKSQRQKNGHTATIIDYANYTDITIQWDDGQTQKISGVLLTSFDKGTLIKRTEKAPNAGIQIADGSGNTFKSKAELCKHYNISKNVFDRDLKRGLSVQEAIDRQLNPSGIKYNGKLYPSFKALGKALGISGQRIKTAVNKGFTIEEILQYAKEGIRIVEPTYDHLGNKYASKEHMCKCYKKEYWMFCSALKGGATLEEALEGNGPKSKYYKSRIGIWENNVCGLKIKITKVYAPRDIDVEFEDGTSIKHINTHIPRNRLFRLKHPTLFPFNENRTNRCRTGTFGSFITKYISSTSDYSKAYYECECTICGQKRVMTPQQMMEHGRSCPKQ